MKKLFFLGAALTCFNLSAVETEDFSSCQDRAFDYADYVYGQTGNGLDAGQAFVVYEALCEAGWL